MRIWWSNYRSMQYRLPHNFSILWYSSCPWESIRWHGSPVISKYYPYWFNKNDFSSYYITLYLLLSFKSMIYSLVREHGHFNQTKRTWFPFILMLPDRNKIGLKYQPVCLLIYINLLMVIMSMRANQMARITSDFKILSLLI